MLPWRSCPGCAWRTPMHLLASLQFCADNGIGCFRINSQILPVKTHAECGYDVCDLPDGDEIVRGSRRAVNSPATTTSERAFIPISLSC